MPRFRRVGWTITLFTLWIALLAPGAGNPVHAESVVFKMALLPIFDALPFYVAEGKGYFKADGVTIEAVSVGSAVERDQLLQAGEIDAVIAEMISAAAFNREKPTVKIVSSARAATSQFPLFRILASPNSALSTPGTLAGVPIAISTNTIIEYVTDRLLTKEGLSQDQIYKQSVPVIPERVQLLLNNRIAAAVIPDPLAKSAMVMGAKEILSDSAHPEYSVSVITVTQKALDGKKQALQVFINGWDSAAKDINANPEDFRSLALEKIRVPKNIEETVQIPTFPRSQVPSEDQWKDMMAWMKDKQLIKEPPSYASTVTAEFLPAP